MKKYMLFGLFVMASDLTTWIEWFWVWMMKNSKYTQAEKNILGMDDEKQQIYPSEKKIMGMDEKKQQIYPSEKKILGMDEKKQQIYPSEKKILGMDEEKQQIYPSWEKIESMDFFFIKHNIPDGEFCHKIIKAL